MIDLMSDRFKPKKIRCKCLIKCIVLIHMRSFG